MTVSDDITDEMLEHVIKSDGLISTPFYKDICSELLRRRQADRWVAVEERFPEETGVYIGWTGENYVGFTFNAHWSIGIDSEIKSWHQLPEPPEVPE